MWLDKSIKHVYDRAIKPAIEDAGYDSFLINREHFTDHITVEIDTQIRQSRFIVADFTHGKDGARGSVYYEAGLARGLNIPVIYTARQDIKPHFDTATYQHIFWTCDRLTDFRSSLKDRILKLPGLGPGPRLT